MPSRSFLSGSDGTCNSLQTLAGALQEDWQAAATAWMVKQHILKLFKSNDVRFVQVEQKEGAGRTVKNNN